MITIISEQKNSLIERFQDFRVFPVYFFFEKYGNRKINVILYFYIFTEFYSLDYNYFNSFVSMRRFFEIQLYFQGLA